MNVCPGCGKRSDRWHSNCMRRLFGTTELPILGDMSTKRVTELAYQVAGKLSISGVQPKLSVRIKEGRLESVFTGGTHILKPPVPQWEEIPENENLCMCLAECAGLQIPPHGLLRDSAGIAVYLIRRFDRADGTRLHTEDFCQASGTPTDGKYRRSAEFCGKLIGGTVGFPDLEIRRFLERIMFNFLVGNGDAHLKNYSFIYGRRGNASLSPCYDLVSSALVLPGEDQSAITINGKHNNLKGRDFEALAVNLGIPVRVFTRMTAHLLSRTEDMLEITENSELGSERRNGLAEIISERAAVLKEVL